MALFQIRHVLSIFHKASRGGASQRQPRSCALPCSRKGNERSSNTVVPMMTTEAFVDRAETKEGKQP